MCVRRAVARRRRRDRRWNVDGFRVSPGCDSSSGRVTPVTKESGKHRAVHFRWACNKHLLNAITRFADNSRHTSPWAAKVYADAIARGHDHPHAVTDPGPGMDQVIYRCWNDGVPTTARNTETPTSSRTPRRQPEPGTMRRVRSQWAGPVLPVITVPGAAETSHVDSCQAAAMF